MKHEESKGWKKIDEHMQVHVLLSFQLLAQQFAFVS